MVIHNSGAKIPNLDISPGGEIIHPVSGCANASKRSQHADDWFVVS